MTLEESIAETKRLRLCVCGQYKDAGKPICKRCFCRLSAEVKDEATGYWEFVAGRPKFREDKRDWIISEARKQHALGNAPAPENESTLDRAGRLQSLLDRGVPISQDDIKWVSGYHRTVGRALRHKDARGRAAEIGRNLTSFVGGGFQP